MAERLLVTGGSQETERDIRIGMKVETDPSGKVPLDERFPDGTRCKLVETGTEGTYGVVKFIPSIIA